MATVEERLDRNERDIQELRESRHTDAVAFGVGQVSADVQALGRRVDDLTTEVREGFGMLTGRLDRVEASVDSMASRFDGIEATLQQIVARLPEQGA